jgi:hypothetical protein
MDDSQIAAELRRLLEKLQADEPQSEPQSEPQPQPQLLAESAEAVSDPFRTLPDEFKIPWGLLRESNTELKLQVKELGDKLEKRNTEFRNKIEKKDAELRGKIEEKDAELRGMIEKKSAMLRDYDRVEEENNKLKRICLGVAILAFIVAVLTAVDSALTYGFQPLHFVAPIITAVSAFYAAWLSYGRGSKTGVKADPARDRPPDAS